MIRNRMLTALLAAVTVFSAASVSAESTYRSKPSKPDGDRASIRISCYRGLVREVVWDRANAVFIDDLIQLGYDLPDATAMAERVCRDEYGVYNPKHQRDTLRRMLRENPPR